MSKDIIPVSGNMNQSNVNHDKIAEKFCSNLIVYFDRLPSKLTALHDGAKGQRQKDGQAVKKVLGERIKKRGGNWKKQL